MFIAEISIVMNNWKQKSIDIVLLNYGIVKQNTKEIFKTRERCINLHGNVHNTKFKKKKASCTKAIWLLKTKSLYIQLYVQTKDLKDEEVISWVCDFVSPSLNIRI